VKKESKVGQTGYGAVREIKAEVPANGSDDTVPTL